MKSHCKYACSNVFTRVFAQFLQKSFMSLEDFLSKKANFQLFKEFVNRTPWKLPPGTWEQNRAGTSLSTFAIEGYSKRPILSFKFLAVTGKQYLKI